MDQPEETRRPHQPSRGKGPRILRFDAPHPPVRPPMRQLRPKRDDDRRDEDRAA